MDTSKEKIRHILQLLFGKGQNLSQAAENVNSVYRPDTVTADQVKFWFLRFRSGNFDFKNAPRWKVYLTGSPVVENINKIMETVESDRHGF